MSGQPPTLSELPVLVTPGQSAEIVRGNNAPARRVLLMGAIVATVAAMLVLFCFDPRQYHFYPLCQFHAYTGLDCPGCGALRAMHQLLHGNVLQALQFNALLVLSLPFICAIGLRFGAAWLAHRTIPQLFAPKWLWVALGISTLFGIARNLPALSLLRP